MAGRQEVGKEEVGGRGWRGKRLFLGPVTCTPKGSAMLLRCPRPTKVGWKERCILFPNREAFQRHSPPRKTLLETFPESFALISVRVGEAVLLKTRTSPGMTTYFAGLVNAKSKGGTPVFISRGQ